MNNFITDLLIFYYKNERFYVFHFQIQFETLRKQRRENWI